jgi:DNA-binding NtrC family response regulator
MCDAGAFRRDLLYRLNAVVVEVPPLRARPEDIEPLARRFVAEASAGQGLAAPRTLDGAALAALLAYPWPGNVRELRNAIERAVVIAEGPAIALDDLPGPVRDVARATWRPVSPPAADAPARAAGEAAVDMRGELDRIEGEMIRRALERARGDRGEAARLLGLPPRTLSDKLRKHGLR